nr:MAG TPA: hypothetical protein [Caudoviricetes sp.]
MPVAPYVNPPRTLREGNISENVLATSTPLIKPVSSYSSRTLVEAVVLAPVPIPKALGTNVKAAV